MNNGGRYKILGRASVDIIKSGGYKISALDIERELLEHPNIAEIAVVGVADEAMGQKIGAIVVTKEVCAFVSSTNFFTKGSESYFGRSKELG